MNAQTNSVPILAERVASARFEALSPRAVETAKTFLLDTFGVGVAGCYGYGLEAVTAVAAAQGAADEATVWVTGQRLPAPAAAFVNAYQIHSLEFDCVNEDAVLHPMATILAAMTAYAERRSAAGRPVSGRDFVAAMVAGVDVSVFLGIASTGPIRFFRPGTAGGFGATAAIARLEGFDADTVAAAFGNQYAQTSGTMQSHVEGSPLLGMQVGFNSRAAIVSCDLAAAGILGPRDTLTGMYGYFRLMENGDFDVARGLAGLEHEPYVTRMSHKPYPTGRLTHGAVDGLGRLMAQHGFAADDVAAVTCTVPQLVHRLVGRPDVPRPAPNYAKLCLPFVAATFLNHGTVDVEHFVGEAMLNDPRTHDLASRVAVVKDDNPRHSAMTPQTVEVRLTSGATHAITLEAVYGHPDAPLTHAEHLGKFWRCWRRVDGLRDEAGERLIAAVDGIEDVADVADLARLTVRGA